MAIQFQHIITSELGLHARPAGLLVKQAKALPCAVTIACRDDSCDARRLMRLLGLGAKQGDVLDVTVEGEGEDAAANELRAFLQENL